MENRLSNNFKYLSQIIEGYYNNPVEYTICRKKRLLLLRNFGEIKDIDFLQDLLEEFVREHIYLVLVKDLQGKTMLETGGDLIRRWILRYHETEDLNDLLRESREAQAAQDTLSGNPSRTPEPEYPPRSLRPKGERV